MRLAANFSVKTYHVSVSSLFVCNLLKLKAGWTLNNIEPDYKRRHQERGFLNRLTSEAVCLPH